MALLLPGSFLAADSCLAAEPDSSLAAEPDSSLAAEPDSSSASEAREPRADLEELREERDKVVIRMGVRTLTEKRMTTAIEFLEANQDTEARAKLESLNFRRLNPYEMALVYRLAAYACFGTEDFESAALGPPVPPFARPGYPQVPPPPRPKALVRRVPSWFWTPAENLKSFDSPPGF